MSYKIVLSASFRRSVKDLKKRFPHVKDDVREAIEILLEQPGLGRVIPGGHGTRKLRLRNSDVRRGKSGGYRLIYLVEEQPEPTIYLLLLYFKSDISDVSRTELHRLIKELQQED